MKNIVLICGLLASSFSFGANSVEQKDKHAQAVNMCISLTELAESAMGARQRGVSLVDMYKTTIDMDNDLREIAEVAIDSAYRVPIASTQEEVGMISLEYRNQFFKDCMYHVKDNL